MLKGVNIRFCGRRSFLGSLTRRLYLQSPKTCSVSSLTSTFNHLSFTHHQHSDSSASSTGLFGIPELSTHKGFQVLRDQAVKEGRDYIQRVFRSTSATQMVEMFDNLSDALCRVADLAEFVRLTHPSEDYRKAAEQCSLSLSSFVETLNTNVELYNSLKSAVLMDGTTIDEETRRVAELFLFDFEESGIHLDANRRAEFVRLQEQILLLGGQFAQGTVTPVYISADNWQPGVKHGFKTFKDLIIVDGLCPNSQDSNLREAAYRTYLRPINSQLDTLDELLLARCDLAKLVGYSSFAERSLNATMAKDPKTVNAFLEKTANMLLEPAEKELKILKAIKDFDTRTTDEVFAWDVHYYMRQAKTQTLHMNTNSLSAYFSIGACMEGLNMVFKSLYNIVLEPVEASKGELWSNQVQKLAVIHKEEGILGYIYCDFYSRYGKLQQDCHFTIQGGRLKSDGGYQHPIVALVCNFPEPTMDKPSLLTHGMVENLFHEMGHAMHSMLARTRYQHVTGTRCSTDFAEVPSILMEYFAWDPRILSSFARHYRTGQVLPEEMIEKLCMSRHMFSALEMQTQVLYAMLDQCLHGEHPLGKTTTEILQEFQNKYTSVPFVPGTAWHQRFGHLHSYGARYYSYLWSRAVASQVWHKCFAGNPLDRQMGLRYRRKMLAHGGGKDPKSLVEDMLGQKLSIDDLVKSLHHDIKKGKAFI